MERARAAWKRFHLADRFAVLVALIVVTSAYDGWLVWKYRGVLMEENPMMLWLIASRDGDVRLALAFKVLGTLLVTFCLAKMFIKHPRYAWPVVIGITVFQIALMGYLLFA